MRLRDRGGEGVDCHLVFVFDTLVFCEPNEDQSTYICWLLLWFEAFSGLKIKLEKMKLF